jgi:hypothetical protein
MPRFAVVTAPLAVPPYALATLEFPCPGLAALAARAPVGGQREAALACLILARLATAVASPANLAIELRRERADAARAWLSTLPLESFLRATLTRAFNATANATPDDIAAELEHVSEKLGTLLDVPSRTDLTRAATRLRR